MNAIEFNPEIKLSFEEILQGISKLDTPAPEDFSTCRISKNKLS